MVVMFGKGLAVETADKSTSNTPEKVITISAEEIERKRKAELKRKQEQLRYYLLNHVDVIPEKIVAGEIKPEQIPNPHWNKTACMACHKGLIDDASSQNLRKKTKQKLCSACHEASFDHSIIHPVELPLDKEKIDRMHPEYRQSLDPKTGYVTCITCHDLTMQCLDEKRYQKTRNSLFLRKGPFESRSQQCFNCHDNSKYERLNPHDQIDDNGQLMEAKCRICHSGSIEDLKAAKGIDEVGFHAEDNLIAMCWGCHPRLPHPGGSFTFFKKKEGPNHLVKPPEEIANKLKFMSTKHNVKFPLDPKTGKVFCATCHNPHEKGVIKNPAAAKGADGKKRLRVEDKICQFCHDK